MKSDMDDSSQGGNELVRLTQRESDVMNGLAAGLLYKEIADNLQISYSAVNKHQHRIYRKLQASNRTEAINKWRDRCGPDRVFSKQ